MIATLEELKAGTSINGLSPGGLAKAGTAAAHTRHGRRSRAHVEKVKAINAELRRITLALRRDGFIP